MGWTVRATVGGHAVLEQEKKHLCIFYSHNPNMDEQNQNLGIMVEADNHVILSH